MAKRPSKSPSPAKPKSWVEWRIVARKGKHYQFAAKSYSIAKILLKIFPKEGTRIIKTRVTVIG